MPSTITTDAVYKCLEQVMDPEIPVLNVLDLGMITAVRAGEDGVHIKMIPTFAACPALALIKQSIQSAVEKALQVPVQVTVDKDVHWNSNRLSAAAREKLRGFGIAAPQLHQGEIRSEMMMQVPCPHCGSEQTYLRSPFGSTLCRAIHYCKSCGMVFEQFKPLE